jgi:phosphoesterase RecJ-like protein
LKNDIRAILELIRKRDRFLITSHVNPDGDSIASQLALRKILLSLGKACTVVNLHPVPRIYQFLPGAGEILVRRRHSMRPYSALFVLDCGHPSRASGFLGRRNPPPVVNFDHHVTNTGYGNLNWTGSFRYSSTTPRSMTIAARLLRHGIDPNGIAEQIYDNAEYGSLRLLGKVLGRLGKTADGRISWITFSHADLSRLSNISETEEFVNYARSLSTALLAIGLKEIKPGSIRISLRSKGEVDVSAFASRYGGGGHRNAAGCSITGSLRSVTRLLVADARLFLNETMKT